jgi:hypothetical protein
VAVDQIYSTYNKDNGYNPVIVQLNRAAKPVLTNVEEEAVKDLFEFHEITYNEFTLEPGNLSHWVNQNTYQPGDQMVVFLEQGFFSVWANYFRPKGVKLILAPDGNKPYYIVTAKAYPSRLRGTFTIYRFLAKFGYYLTKPYFQSLNYGELGRLDEIWVRYPKKYKGSRQDLVKQFSLFNNYHEQHPLNKIYGIQAKLDGIELNRTILYVNNILYEEELYLEEIKVLQYLRDRFPQSSFYLKYHPTTPIKHLERFKAVTNLQLLSTPVPVELFIQNMQNSIIIGMWSAGLMLDNPSCSFYWLNRYLEHKGMMLKRINLSNPTKHIQEPIELAEIDFPKLT